MSCHLSTTYLQFSSAESKSHKKFLNPGKPLPHSILCGLFQVISQLYSFHFIPEIYSNVYSELIWIANVSLCLC